MTDTRSMARSTKLTMSPSELPIRRFIKNSQRVKRRPWNNYRRLYGQIIANKQALEIL
ncbi:4985_t:CDS:2 [Funneliformis mosseae]|uniref:4985_t:CDS:1 n=1 Tax=Funneliformis mosseae TaxID=27381 RepID=A0A9N9FFA5_FUNMO|nr:4985_t:CDS:2 [Funneliformis mosseae]